MDPVAGAISIALINSTIGNIVGKLTTIIDENKKLRKEINEDLYDIKNEMDMINRAIKSHAESEELRGWIREVQELAFDIEDKIDEFTRKVLCSPKAGRLGQGIHKVKTMGSRTEFAKEIQSLKKRAQNAYERKTRYLGSNIPPAAEHYCSPSSSNPYIPEDELVGITEPKQELLRLLGEVEPDSKFKRLKVISILGCRGIGKTTLANVVFGSIKIQCRASVVASECKDARDLVADLLYKLRGGEKDTTFSLAQLGENLSKYLQDEQTYLILIDDLQIEVWQTIKFSFPVSTHGRIIVTTTIQSIAQDWISNGGYVYKMQPLSWEHSKELLWKEIFHRNIPYDFEGLEKILKKCNGLPLALVNIAQLLKNPKLQTSDYCRKLCRDLGSYLHNEQVLSRMKKVLIYSYDNLPGYDIKTCLLSVSIFPEDHHIKRKRLIRRWLAEGLVVKDVRRSQEDVASEYFDKLIDQSLIQPIQTSNNAAVKTCQVHGVVLDFIAHKSMSQNFITLIHNNEPIPNIEANSAVRRLSLHNCTETGAITNIDLSRIRSLTIFGHVGCYMKFQKCKLLRVLDLEKCMELKQSDIQNICKLMQLKYLSLRGTNVCMIPREVSNLHHLGTLDIRETSVRKLPIEVLKLPQLVHLFGKFNLPCQLNEVKKGHKLLTFFSQNSRLETLGGFIIDESHGFQHIMRHISKLRKVKVWSEGIPSTGSVDLLVSSLQTRLFGNNPLQSLSIDFGSSSIDFLDTIQTPCILTSVKLHGKLTKLPDFMKSLQDLELQLSSTALSVDCLLDLQSLEGLLYLKLIEDCPEFADFNFNINSNGFPKLKRLCIQATKLPKLFIGEGAMKQLTSLQLLCEDISGFPLDYISHLKDLKAVTLATAVSRDMKEVWEKEAKKNKNRPEILVEHR